MMRPSFTGASPDAGSDACPDTSRAVHPARTAPGARASRLTGPLGICIVAASALLAGCAGRSDYAAVYAAEQGDLETALTEARSAQGRGISGLFLRSESTQCRDYNAVVTVLVAKGDFAGAAEACSDYDDQCAVVPDSQLCFSYDLEELDQAQRDAEMAGELSGEAQDNLHFRWLMIKDDYEGNPIRRPIY